MSIRGTEGTTPGIASESRRCGSCGELVPDAQLVEQLLDGSEDALARIYDRHACAVFAEARRMSGDRWTAADVVQETFLTLWNRAELFDTSRGELRSWLMTIAHNRAVDHLRSAKRHDRAAAFSSLGSHGDADAATIEWLAAAGEPIAAGGPEPGPEIRLSRSETRATIATAMASMAPFERSVISLAYDAGLSQSEIAIRLGWPIGTVKTRTRAALRHLREQLERSDGDVQARGLDLGRESDRAATVPRLGVRAAAPVQATSSCCS